MEDSVDAIVAQWRRERPELDLEPVAVLGRLFRVARAADAALTRELGGHGLQPGWFDVLAALRRAGRPYELTPSELGAAMLLTSGGVTKRIDRMAEAGLIERRPDPDDRRGTRVRLTRAGKAAIDRAIEAHIANEERMLAPLGAAERQRLDRLLRKLLAGL